MEKIFIIVSLISALGVIIFRNAIHAVLSLIISMTATALVWVLMGQEFLGWLLILVYVGAVAVLFLFVVMILNLELKSNKFIKYWPLAGLSALVGLWLLVSNLTQDSIRMRSLKTAATVKNLGKVMFTQYGWHLQLIGLILTAAIVIVVSLNKRKPQLQKSQDVGLQIAVDKSKRLKMVNIPVELAKKND